MCKYRDMAEIKALGGVKAELSQITAKIYAICT